MKRLVRFIAYGRPHRLNTEAHSLIAEVPGWNVSPLVQVPARKADISTFVDEMNVPCDTLILATHGYFDGHIGSAHLPPFSEVLPAGTVRVRQLIALVCFQDAHERWLHVAPGATVLLSPGLVHNSHMGELLTTQLSHQHVEDATVRGEHWHAYGPERPTGLASRGVSPIARTA